MTRTRLLVALLVAVAIGLAAGWIATQVPAKQERTEDSAVEVRKQLQGRPAPTRQ
jgi:hypothetical protein